MMSFSVQTSQTWKTFFTYTLTGKYEFTQLIDGTDVR